jgi:hypothetical protein
MRCSSGNVSWLTSITGGWYVCIIETGREEGLESERYCWLLFEGEFLVMLSCCVVEADVGMGVVRVRGRGVAVVGDGSSEVEGGFLCGELPPHSDMKERTGGM